MPRARASCYPYALKTPQVQARASQSWNNTAKDQGIIHLLIRERVLKVKEGNIAAHGGDPTTNAMIFKKKKRIRTDDKTFGLLYDMGGGFEKIWYYISL